MRVAKDNVEVRFALPGAVLRQQYGFGSVAGFNEISGEHFTLAKGVDTAPLFLGLDGDLCQCPHWGYVVKGKFRVIYQDREEMLTTGDTYYLNPGHALVYDEDTELVEFSPRGQYQATMEVAARNIAAMLSGAS